MSTSAQAGVGILGGLSFHNVANGNNTGTINFNNGSSKLGIVGGLAFSTNFLLLNVEVDALYDHRTLNFTGGSFSSPAINVPLLARFSVIPTILDFGIGPYASFNVGTNELLYTSPDFGGVGSLRVMIPTPGIHLVIDGRYLFGLTDLYPVGSVHTREFQILAGIDVPFMSN
ncbi:MAG: hypothetical protein H7333_04365 [Bdellovibrionales bacterium]|nr:hypothetical protein [Oligoflexia bacterium]